MTRTTWEANIIFIRGLNTKTQTVVFYLTQSGSSDKPNPVGFFIIQELCCRVRLRFCRGNCGLTTTNALVECQRRKRLKTHIIMNK